MDMSEGLRELKGLLDKMEQMEDVSINVARRLRNHHTIHLEMALEDAMLISAVVLTEMTQDDTDMARAVGRIVNVYVRLTEEEREAALQRPLKLTIER